ncbi:MAG: FAD-binding oxidoreductase [Nocardiopsaceae bacterium]|jgi:FAD/FMN-containing dehydrogenase|nr:FAD-binding oxidoreductase [Nocardiopsaceae bacterium]
MTQLATAGIRELRTVSEGPVMAPGDPGFDQGRRVWNAGIDRTPSVIARCASAADVAAALGFAGKHGLEVSVRGGAHNPAGTAVCDDGLMVDLSLLNQVTVDPAARRARAGGGALLGDLDAATQRHGLAVPAGLISHTGVGGLTLGGGMGWLTRKYGLTIDNLTAAEVVTADGRVLLASETEHPDLFWAIRGGGGNFGVVTSFEFRLHEVDPMVQFGMFFWGLDQGAEALRLAREITAAMPPDINAVAGAVNAPPAPFVPEQHRFQPGYAMLLTGFGPGPEHAELAARIRESLPPLFELVAPLPYVELQKLLDEANAWGHYGYEKGTYLQDLSDPVIEVVTSEVPRKNSPMSVMLFYRLDGAYCRPGDDDTAFSGGRTPRYGTFIIGLAPDPDLAAADRAWVRGVWEALRPHAIGSGDGYINGVADFSEDRIRHSYGAAKYDRLAAIKAQYDPGNVFRNNANIKPAALR